MHSFEEELARRLVVLRRQNLHRELRRVDSPPGPSIRTGGRTLLNFASNDYLGLANDARLKEAAIRAVGEFGAGSGASRLICGSLAPHHELEETVANFKGAEAALAFSTGYATALGTIGALLGKDDIVILDRLVHACIVDASRLCGAKIRVFTHNDLNDLEDKLKWAAAVQNPKSKARSSARTLVITESVFSMDGDAAPLREIVALKEKYGAWLMVDEAHATGLYGQHRRGLAEELGVGGQIEIQMGTLGKAVGAAGGYICGARALIELLVNRARSFIFSTAPVPAAAAAATAGIRLIQSKTGAQRRKQLFDRIGEFTRRYQGRISPFPGAIQPIPIGDEAVAVSVAATLRERSLFVPAVRYPAVARGRARLRATLTAIHKPEDIALLVSSLNEIINHKS